MSIHFISGKPRGGKSLYAVKLCIEELVYGQRCVITNLSFKLPELNAYLQEKYPGRSIDLHDRLRILSDEETNHFWLIRPGNPKISLLTDAQWKAGVKPDYSQVTDNGVLYAIDEIHNFFNARAWMETGRDVLFYLSQHGKLGDTVLCITQAIANVDKQFRSVTQDYTYLRNLKKERMGLFRLPAIFRRQTYLSPATPTSHPMEGGTFTLDVSGIAACYETAKGVGIHGRSADTMEKTKGLSWVWAVIAIPIIVIFFFKTSPNLIAKLFVADPKAVEVKKITSTNTSILPPLPAPVSVSRSVAAVAVSPVVAVRLTGLVGLGGGRWVVALSDGRSYTFPEDRAVEHVGKGFAIVRGETYRW